MIQQITFIGHPEITVAVAAVAAGCGVQCTGVPRISAKVLLEADGTVILINGNGSSPFTSQQAVEVKIANHPTIEIDPATIIDGKATIYIHEWICRNNIERMNIIGERGPSFMADLHSSLNIIRGVILEGLEAAGGSRG